MKIYGNPRPALSQGADFFGRGKKEGAEDFLAQKGGEWLFSEENRVGQYLFLLKKEDP